MRALIAVEVANLRVSTMPLTGVAFNPEERFVLTAGRHGVIRFWPASGE